MELNKLIYPILGMLFFAFIAVVVFRLMSNENSTDDEIQNNTVDIKESTEASALEQSQTGVEEIPNIENSNDSLNSNLVKENTMQENNSKLTQSQKTNFPKPEMVLAEGKEYFVTLNTDKGRIKIKLNSEQTPITANNFYVLAKSGFYDDTIFHRVINGFMIQGGDPLGNGTGSPGYRFNDEPFRGEYKRGTIAMANSGPNTNGSQFFIMHKDYSLPPNYVIFGEVTEGLDVVDNIAEAEVTVSASGENSKPVNPVKITSVKVEEI